MVEGREIISGDYRLVRVSPSPAADSPSLLFGQQAAERARRFHQSFPDYEPTPLVSLDALSRKLGLGAFFVKDESFCFGLNAFKVLGGSYAIASVIAEKTGISPADVTFEKMTSPELKERLGELTFITATDGNHGRGVAWTANRLGQKSVVYMPKGTAPERLDNILRLGSVASITDLSYDDAVRKARSDAEENGWILIQDTSWPGYEQIPSLIMQGYTTIGSEIFEQFGSIVPSHIFLQAGVGSMAGALAGYFTSVFGAENKPVICIVEPDSADCIYKTALADDGELRFAEGEMNSMMAGLCCGEPCPIAWDVLCSTADFCAAIPDGAAASGMRTLAHPEPGDRRIVSGESGASTAGFVIELMLNPELREMREALGLGTDSRVLCISTEGATDTSNYRKITGDSVAVV